MGNIHSPPACEVLIYKPYQISLRIGAHQLPATCKFPVSFLGIGLEKHALALHHAGP